MSTYLKVKTRTGSLYHVTTNDAGEYTHITRFSESPIVRGWAGETREPIVNLPIVDCLPLEVGKSWDLDVLYEGKCVGLVTTQVQEITEIIHE